MKIVWKIANAKRKVPSGLVVEVIYTINFELEGESDRHVGIAQFEGDPAAPGFVPFEQLTEPIILDWVKEKLGEQEISRIITQAQTRLQKRINNKNNPESLEGLPWDNSLS